MRFVLVLVVLLLQMVNSHAKMFLAVPGVKGESDDSIHFELIEILAFSWGASQSGSMQVGGGGAGKTSFSDISLTKYVDRSSPPLLSHLATGKTYSEVKLYVRGAEGAGAEKTFDYLVITLTNVLVTSLSVSGSAGESRMSENISLNFAKYRFEYTETADDLSPGAKYQSGFDIVNNVPA